MTARAALVRSFLVVAALLATGISGLPMAMAAPAEPIFTSLEQPPTPEEVAAAIASGIRTFEMDLDEPSAPHAVQAIKAAGGRVTAYHVGGGGGRAWGSVKAGEFVRKYDTPESLAALSAEVRDLVRRGADDIHFDNTHRMSGKRLEAVADAIRAGGAGFVAKNNAGKWRLVMRRRPDLKPTYAVVEEAMFDAAETQAAFDLNDKGVPVVIVGFRVPLEKNALAVSDDYAAAYKAANPWATVLLMADERRYESRGGRYF